MWVGANFVVCGSSIIVYCLTTVLVINAQALATQNIKYHKKLLIIIYWFWIILMIGWLN